MYRTHTVHRPPSFARHSPAVLFVVVSALAVACAGEATKAGVVDVTAQTESGLGEPGCGTVAVPAQTATNLAGSAAGVSATLAHWTDSTPSCKSPDLGAAAIAPGSVAYGSAACPGQYVLEVGGTFTLPGPAIPEVLPHAGIDQATCPSLGATMGVYGRTSDTSPFTLILQRTTGGLWNYGTGLCDLVETSSNGIFPIPANTYTALRVAGSVYTLSYNKGMTVTTPILPYVNVTSYPSCH